MEGRLAAARAILDRLEDGQIIGLGSGRTVALALTLLGDKVRRDGLHVSFVASSLQIALEAQRHGLATSLLGTVDHIDWSLDGADEVDRSLRLIKGGGGALTRERILAHLSNLYIILVDEGKVSDQVGRKSPVPIELIPQALPLTEERLRREGVRFTLRVDGRGYPVVTENGNLLIDAEIQGLDPEAFFNKFRGQPGILDVGIFLHEADEVIIGREDGSIERLTRG